MARILLLYDRAVRSEKTEAEFITAEITGRQWWRRRSDFLGTGDRLPCGR